MVVSGDVGECYVGSKNTTDELHHQPPFKSELRGRDRIIGICD